jgi:hypothetical protein
VLSDYLCEFTCREFAHEGKIPVIVLRLGKVVRAEEVVDKVFDPLWVDERDVAQAVSLSLSVKLADNSNKVGRWAVFHIQSNSPLARFSSARANGALGYNPQFSW